MDNACGLKARGMAMARITNPRQRGEDKVEQATR
jgi:hypothetical protein